MYTDVVSETKKRKRRPKADGNCYEAALVFAAYSVPDDERDRYRVVHGFPIGQGPIEGLKHGHAWVERTDDMPNLSSVPAEMAAHFTEMYERNPELLITVIDKSNGKDLEMSRTVYYGFGNIDRSECTYYKVDEAMRLAVRYGHWGPWGEEPSGVV